LVQDGQIHELVQAMHSVCVTIDEHCYVDFIDTIILMTSYAIVEHACSFTLYLHIFTSQLLYSFVS